MNLYLIAIYVLKTMKAKQTLFQTTGNCKELNSSLYNCGWFLYIWGWLSASFSNCGQFRLYIYRFPVHTNLVNLIQFWFIFIHLWEVLYICGNLCIWGSNNQGQLRLCRLYICQNLRNLQVISIFEIFGWMDGWMDVLLVISKM